jgi:AcrR family transcriptional regulator
VGRPRKVSDAELRAAAVRAIAARGPANLRLSDVAAEAGVATATVAERFGSKRALLVAVAEGGPDAVGAVFARHRDVEAALLELAGGLREPGHAGFLALDLTDDELRGHAAATLRRLRAELAARLGAERAEVVHAVYQGTLLTWTIDREGDVRDRLRAALRAVGCSSCTASAPT